MMFISCLYLSVVICNSSVVVCYPSVVVCYSSVVVCYPSVLVCTRLSLGGSFRIDHHNNVDLYFYDFMFCCDDHDWSVNVLLLTGCIVDKA